MNNPVSNKTFIFNAAIDPQSINNLYGDDYDYIEEVFDTVLQEYETLANHIAAAFAASDLSNLKSSVHKIKPIFGFVGILEVQHECQQFENLCQSAASVLAVSSDYQNLYKHIIISKEIIEEEKRKLAVFNNNRS